MSIELRNKFLSLAYRMGFRKEYAEEIASEAYCLHLESLKRGTKPRSYRFLVIDAIRNLFGSTRSDKMHSWLINSVDFNEGLEIGNG